MDTTKRELRSALGFTKDRELAEFFGISKAAISKWPEDGPLPEGRIWQARARRPDAFAANDAENDPGQSPDPDPARRRSAVSGETAEAVADQVRPLKEAA